MYRHSFLARSGMESPTLVGLRKGFGLLAVVLLLYLAWRLVGGSHSSGKFTVGEMEWTKTFRQADRVVNWTDGGAIGTCFGRREESKLSVKAKSRQTSDIRKTRLAILVRGHMRKTDADDRAATSLRSLLKLFPNSKVFFQSWSVRQTSHSWRQSELKQHVGVVDKALIENYYRIPKERIGGILIESEEEILPELRRLYPESAFSNNRHVCEGYRTMTPAPNLGWLQMWWGIRQVSAMAMQSRSEFDVVLNFRHDMYNILGDILKDATVMQKLVATYVEHAPKSPTDINCWVFRKDMKYGQELQVDILWVTSMWSNYVLTSKWLYEYMTMQDIFCRANDQRYQERMVYWSASVLL